MPQSLSIFLLELFELFRILQFLTVPNDVVERVLQLLLQCRRNGVLECLGGLYLLIQYTESYIFEIGDSLDLLIEKNLLSDDIDKISIVNVLNSFFFTDHLIRHPLCKGFLWVFVKHGKRS